VAAVHGDNNAHVITEWISRNVSGPAEIGRRRKLEDLGTQSTDASQLRIKFEDLFNFEDTWWIRTQEQIGMRGLDEELEVYELLDMDTAGEDDVDIDVDDMTTELIWQN
jgi:hypothetical protein